MGSVLTDGVLVTGSMLSGVAPSVVEVVVVVVAMVVVVVVGVAIKDSDQNASSD